MNKIRRIITIIIICGFLTLGVYGCIKSHGYHNMNDDKWLIEQVEKGYLTQEEADEIRRENAGK